MPPKLKTMTSGFVNAKDIYEFKETFRHKIKGGHYMERDTTPFRYLGVS